MTTHIRPFDPADYSACARIYAEGMATGIATFETKVPDWERWNVKFLKQCRWVAENDHGVIGWCALTAFSSRTVYKGVAEVTVYVAAESQGKGVGQQLLKKLILDSEASGFWTLLAKVFEENTASIRLHEKQGFRRVGVLEKIGMREGIWYNNILLERRIK